MVNIDTIKAIEANLEEDGEINIPFLAELLAEMKERIDTCERVAYTNQSNLK